MIVMNWAKSEKQEIRRTKPDAVYELQKKSFTSCKFYEYLKKYIGYERLSLMTLFACYFWTRVCFILLSGKVYALLYDMFYYHKVVLLQI